MNQPKETTLYFLVNGALVVVPWNKQSSTELAREFHNKPCLIVGEDVTGKYWIFAKYNYLGSKVLPKSKVPSQLQTLKFLLT